MKITLSYLGMYFYLFVFGYISALIMSKQRKVLTNEVKPIKYDILLDTNTTDKTFMGRVKILLKADFSTDVFYLNYEDLEILSHEVLDKKSELIMDEKNQKLGIKLSEPLKEGEEFNVIFLYKGNITRSMSGYYLSKDSLTEDKKDVYSTHFEPTKARSAFPCFDQPDMKAVFVIALTVPTGLTVLSNTQQENEINISNNKSHINEKETTIDLEQNIERIKGEKKDELPANNLLQVKSNSLKKNTENLASYGNEDRANIDFFSKLHLYDQTILLKSNNTRLVFFKETPIMSTYLVAWAMGDLEYEERISEYEPKIRIRVYTPKGEKSKGLFALDVAHDCIKIFQDYFEINYPLDKMDMIAIPEFAMGAMENWGLVTYRRSSLLYDEKNSPVRTKQLVAETVCHELAHQWFGNLATMTWWEDIWLNEGFATWAAALAISKLRKDLIDWDIWTAFIASDVEYGLGYDALHSSHPILVPVNDPEEIDEIFDGISYSKGASLIRMLEDYVGSEVFRKSLVNYLTEYSYSNASTCDLWRHIEKVSNNENIQNIMDIWVNKVGFPLIKVSDVGGSLSITQERFLLIKDYKNQDEEVEEKEQKLNMALQTQYWFVPIKINFFDMEIPNDNPKRAKLANENTEMYELSQAKQDFTIKNKNNGYKINNDGTGFYRVMYENPERVIELLANASLSPKNKLNLVCDLFQLSIATQIDSSFPIRASSAFMNEDNFEVFSSVIGGLSEIKGIFYNNQAELEKMVVLLSSLVKDRVDSIDIKNGGADINEMNLKGSIIATAVNNNEEKTIEKLYEIYKNYQDNKDAIHPIFRGSMFISAVQKNEDGVFMDIWKQFNEEENADVKVTILSSLGSTNDEAHFEFLKNELMNDNIKKQDIMYLYGSLISNVMRRDQMVDFVMENIQKIMSKFEKNASILGYIVERVFSSISERKRYENVRAMFITLNTKSIKRSVAKSLERAAIRVNFREAYLDNTEKMLVSANTKKERRIGS